MNNRVMLFAPITKLDEEQRMVYGIATTSAIDKQNEIVDWGATKEALDDYSKWRNIREMHKQSAVGVAPLLELRDDKQELFIGAKVVDDQAWTKCKEGVYKGFSIGGEVLDRKVEFNKVSNKTVNRVTKYVMNEISLVDRPANPECIFQTVKRDTTIETVTVQDDPLKNESMRVMEKAITLSKRVLSKIELEKLPDEQFGLIKVVSDGDRLIKHRQYPMPDRTHAINMINKMVGSDELSNEEKERIHQTAVQVLGKKHCEDECPYCIKNKIGGEAVEKKEIKKADGFQVMEDPKKKEEELLAEKPVEGLAIKPEEKPKSDIVVDEEVATADTTTVLSQLNEKLDRLISLLCDDTTTEGQYAADEEVPVKEEEELVTEEVLPPAEEEEIKEYDEDEEPAKADVVPAEEKKEEEKEELVAECNKAVKTKMVKKALKLGVLSKIDKRVKSIVEPIVKENKELKDRIAKLEAKPLPRRDGKGESIVKIEKYAAGPELQKSFEPEYSDDLQKDVTKATELRKSGKALSSDEQAFCQRVAEKMLDAKLNKTA